MKAAGTVCAQGCTVDLLGWVAVRHGQQCIKHMTSCKGEKPPNEQECTDLSTAKYFFLKLTFGTQDSGNFVIQGSVKNKIRAHKVFSHSAGG